MGMIISQPIITRGNHVKRRPQGKEKRKIPVTPVRATLAIKLRPPEQADDDRATEADVVHKSVLSLRIAVVE
jgi:hypothetical protein